MQRRGDQMYCEIKLFVVSLLIPHLEAFETAGLM